MTFQNYIFQFHLQYIVEENQLPSRCLCISVWNRTSYMQNHFIGLIALPLVTLNLKDPSHCWYILREVKSFGVVGMV